jgi:hypothetical protein
MKNYSGTRKLGCQLLLLALLTAIGSLGCSKSVTMTLDVNATYQLQSSTMTPATIKTKVVTVQPSFTAMLASTRISPSLPTNQVSTLPLGGNLTATPRYELSTSPIISTQDITQADQSRVMAALQRVTGLEPICTENGCHTINNRVTGSEGLRWVKEYIYSELVKLGYAVEVQSWTRSGYTDQNIIAMKLGEIMPNEEIYFVAHMDGVNGGATDLFPAADDNASGVIDLLEMARVISSISFQRTVVFLFTTGEEQGTLGVRDYLDHLSQQELSSIKFAVDIDMVGYDANRDAKMELWYGGHAPSLALAQTMSDIIKTSQFHLAPGFVIGCG